jgi:Ni2+-binding GTPase involved in maturation of urease and hydrogenase
MATGSDDAARPRLAVVGEPGSGATALLARLLRAGIAASDDAATALNGKGLYTQLHSSTSQINLSRFCHRDLIQSLDVPLKRCSRQA